MKKIMLILIPIISLFGCKNSIVLNQEDAKEIALDASGYSEEEVKNLNISEGNGYDVEFVSEGGEYKYHIGSDGIITKRNIKSYTNIDDEDVIEKKDEKKEEEPEKKIDEEKENKIISMALMNLGLRENQVENINVEELDNGTYSVKCTVIVNSNRFETIVDFEANRVLSSYIIQE